MWLEGLLEATGRRHPDFAEGCPLFDEILCATIALDPAALRAFVRTAPLPDYLACERWVRTHARRLDPASIAQVDNAVRKAAVDGTPLALRDDLRAWRAVYDDVLAGRDTAREPIVPALSSRAAGPLGVDHLPRMWLKNVLKAVGALPIGYRSGTVRVVRRGLAFVPEGIDARTCSDIGLDMRASMAYVDAELPDYPTYESWVRRHARKLDVASVARHNADRGDTRAPKAAAEKAYAGWDGASDWGYLVDDLIDWRLLYDVVSGGTIPSWTGP